MEMCSSCYTTLETTHMILQKNGNAYIIFFYIRNDTYNIVVRACKNEGYMTFIMQGYVTFILGWGSIR